jgi:RNA polymerase sigma-70 factor (ECF subfamily)
VDKREIKTIRAAVKGDRESFGELFKMYYPKIYVLARSRLHDAAEADEVAQLTLFTVWQKFATLQNPEAFPAWITRITINNCNKVFRRDKRRVSGDDEELLSEIAETNEELLPEPAALRADMRARLGNAINDLSEKQREATLLFYYSQLSVQEIAQATGVSPNTVKSRLSLARKYIKRRLQAEDAATPARLSVAGVSLAVLAPAIHEQFAAWEPTLEMTSVAQKEVMEKIGAAPPAPVATATQVSGRKPAYLDELHIELRMLMSTEIPLVPAGSLWPKSEDNLLEGDNLTLEHYLRHIRDYRERVEATEQRYLLAAENLIASVCG